MASNACAASAHTTLEAIADHLLLAESVHDPRADHGKPTTAADARLALADDGIVPSEELVNAVFSLVEARRPTA